ncbi:MAG: hypothetical protein IT428_11350 [Planctomycetaceae bacterium]|nr:hypothetical protein [Planctomycetaceae bacterium]
MPSVSSPSPEAEYERRLAERRGLADALQRKSDAISTTRGVVFLVAAAIALAAYNIEGVSFAWLAVPGIAFVGLVIAHDFIERRKSLAARAVKHYEWGLDRLRDAWVGRGSDGARYIVPDHPYVADLDIFGRGSLYQLMCRARTRLGEDTLARWLSVAAEVSAVRERQQAVEELRPQLDLRERLALLTADRGEDLDQGRLLSWAQAAPQPLAPGIRIAAVGLAVMAVASLWSWLSGKATLAPLIAVVLVEVAFLFSLGKRIRASATAADEADSGLKILARVLHVIESQTFHSPLLQAQARKLETEGRPPSRWIARLHQRIHFLQSSLQNQAFAPIALLLCLPVHFTHAIEVWRLHAGPHIADWLQSVGEFEALSSLAGYAWERPADRFPELTESGPQFVADEIAHPLLPETTAVRNSVSLGNGRQLLLVSGSNMSGKSTLLRTVGINVVLALAGAPVRARRLTVSPLQVGTEMRVSDSLQQGQSLFYAVIRRLKQVVDRSRQSPPLLFLLDEILQGTNSHDRRHGAEGVIRTLVEAGAIGLVTTHDLALTEIVSSFGSRAENIHFEDRLEDGRMTFDYRIRPGVVQRSNALELMRMMGLAGPPEAK